MDANPAGLAQLVEHLSCKQDVVSSILTLGSPIERRSLATARCRSFPLRPAIQQAAYHAHLTALANWGSYCRQTAVTASSSLGLAEPLAADFVEGEGAGGRDVEGRQAAGHGDRHDHVAAFANQPGQAGALGSEHDNDWFGGKVA